MEYSLSCLTVMRLELLYSTWSIDIFIYICDVMFNTVKLSYRQSSRFLHGVISDWDFLSFMQLFVLTLPINHLFPHSEGI